MTRINSHNSWSRLREVWLGDVYPGDWYDHLQPAVRDVFQELTAITQQDLTAIQKTLESFDIVVQRPQYHCIEDFLQQDNLVKPEICPRDRYLTLGNCLLTPYTSTRAWEHVLAEYRAEPGSTVQQGCSHIINGANVVRVGRDVIVDRDCFDYTYQNEWPEYRVQVVENGGHLDGCFAILRPGLILANHYFNDYENTFPGWDIIMLDNPTYHAAPHTGYQQPYPVYNGKFWNTTVGTNRTFNDHIIAHALDWVGCYTETYFELNCLVIDEHNVVMLAENHELANTLAQHNITVHWVPFRARSFWDGAMHCLTVDIQRDSTIEDFFSGARMSAIIISYPPGAGGNHLKNILCLDQSFANSTDLDLAVYDTPIEPPGTVHSRPGRNVHEYRVNDIVNSVDQRWIMHGHFGELAPYREKINSIKEKIFVLISLNQPRDQELLTRRQQRLGYGHHPYWNQEEQPYLYQPQMYTNWFAGDRIVDISIYDFWSPNYIATGFVDWLNSVLDTKVNAESAQNLHTKWWQQNFFFGFCNYTRGVYGVV